MTDKLLKASFVLLSFIVLLYVDAFVFYKISQWLITPITGLRNITIVESLSFLFILHFLLPTKKEIKDINTFYVILFNSFVKLFLYLSFAYILSFFL